MEPFMRIPASSVGSGSPIRTRQPGQAARPNRSGQCAPPSGSQQPPAAEHLALNEYQLAARWGISAKTLRRWRQEQIGPVFLKIGARVSYLLPDVEAFEDRVARFSTCRNAYRWGGRS